MAVLWAAAGKTGRRIQVYAEMEENMKYEITVGEVKTQNSNVRGYASVVFGDSFKVSNITILANRDNQLYISMPVRHVPVYKIVGNCIQKQALIKERESSD